MCATVRPSMLPRPEYLDAFKARWVPWIPLSISRRETLIVMKDTPDRVSVRAFTRSKYKRFSRVPHGTRMLKLEAR